MGFSFALHWAQVGHQNILAKAGIIPVGNFLIDFAPRGGVTKHLPIAGIALILTTIVTIVMSIVMTII